MPDESEDKVTEQLFNVPYNVCPRYPQGTKWEVYMRSRYASCAWNMESFQKALEYLREQYVGEVRATRVLRGPGDAHRQAEFSGWIDGPGGRMDWSTIEALVKE